MGKEIKILLLAGNTLRARAYAQILANSGFENLQVFGLFYGFNTKRCNVPELNIDTKKYFEKEKLFIPNFNESLQITFTKNKWNYLEIDTIDVNSDAVLRSLKKFDKYIIVFAGYGGQLLGKQHFNSERKYLHMHPGKLPVERGSTTLYYSILNKRNCTVTSFFMTSKIDEGENILFSEYNVPHKGCDLDQWFDNVIRSDCFFKSLGYLQNQSVNGKNYINEEISEEYYVIHPVLKHVALLSLREIQEL